jgi:hypothetical protein
MLDFFNLSIYISIYPWIGDIEMMKYRDKNGRQYTPDPIEYFWDNVKKDPVSGCWNWRGNMFATGYGQFKNGRVNNGVPLAASRAAWMLFKGDIPPKNVVCHKCDNPRCVNYEDHLFIGSYSANMVDASVKKRINHGEDRPQSKLTEAMVREMRQLRQQGWSWEQLVAKFGTTKNCIRSATLGQTWSHVDEPIPTISIGPGRRKGG